MRKQFAESVKKMMKGGQANGNLQSESPNSAASMLRCWQWRDACEHVDISASGLGILCRHVNMPFWMF
eukprot:symbB.v1.2.018670.t3/scaffold1455.1/size117749/6